MPDPQGAICSGTARHLMISPWSASFSQTEISFERKQEQRNEELAAPAAERKLTFPSSSSLLRSKDRCSWTAVEPEEPCGGGGTETEERQRQDEEKDTFICRICSFVKCKIEDLTVDMQKLLSKFMPRLSNRTVHAA